MQTTKNEEVRTLTAEEGKFFEQYGLNCRVVPNILAQAVQELADELAKVSIDPLVARQTQSWNLLRNQVVGHERTLEE